MSRKATPDVLGEVMGSSKTESNKSIKKSKNKRVKQLENKEINPNVNNKIDKSINTNIKKGGNRKIENERNNAVKKVKNTAIFQEWNNALWQKSPKGKATFNLTVEAVDLLEETWINLRRTKRTAKITKSLIVEKAIRNMLSDCNL